jgi:hypothetical protein
MLLRNIREEGKSRLIQTTSIIEIKGFVFDQKCAQKITRKMDRVHLRVTKAICHLFLLDLLDKQSSKRRDYEKAFDDPHVVYTRTMRGKFGIDLYRALPR